VTSRETASSRRSSKSDPRRDACRPEAAGVSQPAGRRDQVRGLVPACRSALRSFSPASQRAGPGRHFGVRPHRGRFPARMPALSPAARLSGSSAWTGEHQAAEKVRQLEDLVAAYELCRSLASAGPRGHGHRRRPRTDTWPGPAPEDHEASSAGVNFAEPTTPCRPTEVRYWPDPDAPDPNGLAPADVRARPSTRFDALPRRSVGGCLGQQPMLEPVDSGAVRLASGESSVPVKQFEQTDGGPPGTHGHLLENRHRHQALDAGLGRSRCEAGEVERSGAERHRVDSLAQLR
jgi:hypothetical protein